MLLHCYSNFKGSRRSEGLFASPQEARALLLEPCVAVACLDQGGKVQSRGELVPACLSTRSWEHRCAAA